jgi:flagellar protein FliO/FliZ
VIELVVRIGFSLLVVFGLMWMLAKLARRPMARRGGTVTVLARQSLTRNASVAVVRVADRALVLGVTDGQVTLLAETDPAALERAEEPAGHRATVAVAPTASEATALVAGAGRLDGSLLSPAMWGQTMNFVRERTVRR